MLVTFMYVIAVYCTFALMGVKKYLLWNKEIDKGQGVANVEPVKAFDWRIENAPLKRFSIRVHGSGCSVDSQGCLFIAHLY